MAILKSLASFISTRSSALVATCVFTLWDMRLESQREYIASLPAASPLLAEAQADEAMANTVVSFNGSVIENYPGYRESCQRYVDFLIASKEVSDRKSSIELVPAKESSLLGAAVASACVVRDV